MLRPCRAKLQYQKGVLQRDGEWVIRIQANTSSIHTEICFEEYNRIGQSRRLKNRVTEDNENRTG